jgi:hypothetical protein
MKKDLASLLLWVIVILDSVSLLAVWILMNTFTMSTQWILISLVAVKLSLLISMFIESKEKSQEKGLT